MDRNRCSDWPEFAYAKNVLSSPMFYMSAYLESHRDVYYARLRAISEKGDWNGWIAFFLEAVVEQAKENSEKVRGILSLYNRMKSEVPKAVRSGYVVHAIDALFDRPVFRCPDFVRRSRIPKQTGIRILNVLKKTGLIRDLRPGRGRRAAIMEFPELMRITEGR